MLENNNGSIFQYCDTNTIYGAVAEPIVPAAELAPSAKDLTVTGKSSVK